MLTIEQLQSIMPGASSKRNSEFLPFLQAAMTEFAIESPARSAAFVAQLAHESGQFRFMEEIWGPTAAQRRYEPPSSLATDLGNTEAGDGKRFKGRGPIQITGRANYRRFGDLLGLDLVADPNRAALPEVAFRIAGLFWSRKGLNELADQVTPEAFRAITKRINGGFNGLAERERFYEAAKAVLGVTGPAVTRGAPEPVGEEPAFERGFEAIRSDAGARVTGKARKKKRAASKRVSKKGKAKTRTAKKASGKGAARKTARKGAAKRRAAKKRRRSG
jgi:predicted chitinase